MKAKSCRKFVIEYAIAQLQNILFKRYEMESIIFDLSRLTREELLYIILPIWKGMVKNVRQQIRSEQRNGFQSDETVAREDWVNQCNRAFKGFVKSYDWSQESDVRRTSTTRTCWFIDTPMMVTYPDYGDFLNPEVVEVQEWMVISTPKVIGNHNSGEKYRHPSHKPYSRNREKAEAARLMYGDEGTLTRSKKSRKADRNGLKSSAGLVNKKPGMPMVEFDTMARLVRQGKPMDSLAKFVSERTENQPIPVDTDNSGPREWQPRRYTSKQSVIRSGHINEVCTGLDYIRT